MVLNSVHFANNGTTNFSGSNPLSINNGAVFGNNSGANFNISTSQPINTDNVASPALNNLGSINLGSGANPTINVVVNNGGTISLLDSSSNQTLTLAGGGTHTGTFNTGTPPNGTVAFNGAHVFNSGWTWSSGPASTFELLGGSATINNNFVTPFFTQDGGTLSGTGIISISSNFDWKGGTQTGSGTTALSGAASIDGTSTATLDGGRILDVQSGTTLTYNPGVGGSLAFTNSGVMTLNGTLDIKSDNTISSDGTATINVGTGSMDKTAGVRTLVQPFVTVASSGSFVPSAGTTIALGGSATIAGLINTSAAGSALEVAANTTTIASGTTVNSANLLLTGGTLTVNTPLTIATLTESGGTLTGNQTLSTGTLNWTGGIMDGGGSTGALLVINTGNINGGATQIRNHFALTNAGTMHYIPAAALAVNQGGLIQNNGTWNLENNIAITSDLGVVVTAPSFTNTSTLSKTFGGATSFGLPFANSGGSITLNNAADVDFTGGGTLNGGTVTFNNSGDVVGIQTNTMTITNAPLFSGPGFVRVSNLGILQNNVTTSIPNFELDNGGTLSGGGTLNITAGLKSTGGTLTGNGTTNLGSGASGDLTSLAGNLTLNIHTFNNAGTINYNPTLPIAFPGSGHFVNQPTGILNITGAGGTSTSGTSNTFVNQGTINRSGAATFFTFDLPFTNSGTVDAQSANNFVAFSNGGSMSGGTMKGSVASAGIEFGGGTFNVTGGTWGTVGGVKINGGTLNINTAMTAPAGFALVSGTLGTTASGSLTMNSGSTATSRAARS
jgi:hypothetical protein